MRNDGASRLQNNPVIASTLIAGVSWHLRRWKPTKNIIKPVFRAWDSRGKLPDAGIEKDGDV